MFILETSPLINEEFFFSNLLSRLMCLYPKT
ncbi:hypothetical protein OIU77_001262 [Salix suchowensis]|uniref:Uncharacterized protein n=1 Tax=Salix suchowensis TaxID=1278906 RepID=A0ABQ9B108_9ROSI|nr:hypothetical protein OIU77_001262 [Salix suchowensis]